MEPPLQFLSPYTIVVAPPPPPPPQIFENILNTNSVQDTCMYVEQVMIEKILTMICYTIIVVVILLCVLPCTCVAGKFGGNNILHVFSAIVGRTMTLKRRRAAMSIYP